MRLFGAFLSAREAAINLAGTSLRAVPGVRLPTASEPGGLISERRKEIPRVNGWRTGDVVV